MCGIAGFSLSPEDNIRVNSKRLAKELFLGIESRGKDATGFAVPSSNGGFQIHKAPTRASDFVKKNLCIPRRAPLAILHTRAWTTGTPTINGNNHPIPSGPIVGVHNGWLTNDYALWGEVVKRNRQQAEVDSEVIFAMLAYGMEDSGATALDVLAEVEGNMAVAWMDREYEGRLYLARGYGSPLIVGQTLGGSLIFASEAEFVHTAAEEAKLHLTHVRTIEEGTYMEVEEGEVKVIKTFDPNAPTRSARGGWQGYSNGYSKSTVKVRNLVDQAWDDEWDIEDYFIARELKATAPFRSAQDAAMTFLGASEDTPDLANTPTAYSEDWLDRRLFNPTCPVPCTDVEGYRLAYEEREVTISDWFLGYNGDSQSMIDTAVRLKAFARPGMYVTTIVNGRKFAGQLVLLPNTFPVGKFLVRVYLPLEENGKVETILVERTWNQFDITPPRERSYPGTDLVPVS